VTFHPQVQEIPPRGDILLSEAVHRVEISGYRPTSSPDSTLHRAGGTSGNYSGWVCLVEDVLFDAFATGDGYVDESGRPTFASLDTPAYLTGASVGTKIVLTLSEPIDPAGFAYPDFVLVVSTANGNVVVPVTATLRNIVGPPGVRKCIVTLTPRFVLPPSATVKVILSATITDFAGNSLVPAIRSFTTETGTPQTFTTTESFTSTTYRDEDGTTAHWGTKVSGRLTGLDDGGTGKDGALTVKSGTTTLSNNVYNFTTLTVEEGATLKFSTTKAVELYVQGDVTIKGTIDVSGGDGDDSSTTYSYFLSKPSSDVLSNPGGKGGPGGGDGGSVTASLPAFKTLEFVYAYHEGGDGKGEGGGKGSIFGSPTGIRGSGGGGGGHEESGADGQTYCRDSAYGSTGGKGGSSYGFADLRELAGGSGGGGGSGGTRSYYKDSSSWSHIAYVGAGGGGGGGALRVVTLGRMQVAVSGRILAGGGDGGLGWVRAGFGGGGSGGAIHLRSAVDIEILGLLDASGGAGGSTAGVGQHTWGGWGSGGRVRLEEPKLPSNPIVAMGDFAVSVIKSISDGGSMAGTDGKLAPSQNLTLTTSSSKSTWYFTEIDIQSGVTVTIQGDRPARLFGRDGITIAGAIRADGGVGEEGAYKGTVGFTSVQGGKAGPGGGRGGRSHTKNGQVSAAESAEAGQGTGGGKGGTRGGPGAPSTYWEGDYCFPGSGGGASHGSQGGDGDSDSFPAADANPGVGGKAGITYGSTAEMSPSDISGGSGGGGGANAMKDGDYYQTGSGGGGGGALTLETPKALKLPGQVTVNGGDGGFGDGFGAWSLQAGGGGGSGGSVLLRAVTFDIPLGTVDASGGRSGNRGYSQRCMGGAGGNGRIKLESTSSFPYINLAEKIKTGSYSSAVFVGSDTGVTTWFDTVSLNPTYKTLTSTVYPSDGSQTKVWLEVCRTDPDTMGPDEENVVQLTAAEVASGKADGYRFYRFRLKFEPGDEDPYVDEVKVTGSIVKK
jgi:Big-like domain-containing protein